MDNQPNILKILQSIPGPYKAEYIKQQTSAGSWPMYAMVCSEDQYTPELLKDYNSGIIDKPAVNISPAGLCFRRAVRLITSNAPFVIIDNPNLHVEDVAPYVRLAEAYGYDYEIVYLANPCDISTASDEDWANYVLLDRTAWPWKRTVISTS
jgi:hypothetical protein